MQERIDQRPFFDDLVGQAGFGRGDGGRQPGRAGANDEDVTTSYIILMIRRKAESVRIPNVRLKPELRSEVRLRAFCVFRGLADLSAAAAGRYSNSRLLTIATGRPGMTAVSWPAGVIASSVSPSRLTSSTPAGTVMIDLLASGGRDRFEAARAGAAADPIEEVGRRAELGFDRRRGSAGRPSSSARRSRRDSCAYPLPRFISSSE